MIREATTADRAALIRLGEAFLAEQCYGLSQAAVLTDDVLNRGTALLNDTDTAMLAWICAQHPMTGRPTAFELAWYVVPEARGGIVGARLLTRFAELAAAQGAIDLQMSVLTDRQAQHLVRFGYTVKELTLVKTLTPWPEAHRPPSPPTAPEAA